MVTIEELLERHNGVKHSPFTTIAERRANGDVGASRTMIVGCVDPRCVPEEVFAFKSAEVVVHRNAGGNAKHALRDILILDTLMGLNEILLLQHTDCGMLVGTENDMKDWIKKGNWAHQGIDEHAWPEVDKVDFGMIKGSTVEDAAKRDLQWIRDQPLLREELKKKTRAFVFDIKSGAVNEVTL